MANEVTHPAEKTPEEIEREMLQTRESLTEKVAALESQVVGTVQTAADTLSGTVEAVKEFVTTAPSAVGDTVKQAASAVSETVKKTLDVSGHVRDHPWAAVGVSAGLGFLTGLLVFRERPSFARLASESPAPATFTPPGPAPGAAAGGPGFFDDLIGMLGRKVREVAENVVDTATAALNQTVRESVPKLVDAAAEHLAPDAAGAPRTTGTGVGYRG